MSQVWSDLRDLATSMDIARSTHRIFHKVKVKNFEVEQDEKNKSRCVVQK